jgi:prephenate dehydrogenase
MASSGFHDLTRLASGDPEMAHDVFLTNRDAALHWVDRMLDELQRYRDLLQGDSESLLEAFARAKAERDEFLAQPRPRREAEQQSDVRQELMNSLMGGWIADRVKKARELPGLAIEAQDGGVDKKTRVERIAEDIRRDLEKLDKKKG